MGLLVVLAALVFVTFAALGTWQVTRLFWKLDLIARIEQRVHAKEVTAPLPDQWAKLNAPNDEYRRIRITGIFIAGQDTLVQAVTERGGGFWVLTPLKQQDTGQVILVQRGWVPRNFNDRALLSEVQTPAGPVAVTGRIAPPPSKLYEFKGVDTGRLRQNIDLKAYRMETGLPLLDVSLLQTGGPSEGLLRDWAAPNIGVDKHYGYAFQWFGLCALVVGLYGWYQVIVPARRKFAGAVTAPPSPSSPDR